MDEDEDEREEIRDDEEVAEEATPETDEEATEQRTDDYDGIVRRLDDIADMMRERFDSIDRMLDALGVSAVEGDATVDAGETAAEVIDEILGIDGLDLL